MRDIVSPLNKILSFAMFCCFICNLRTSLIYLFLLTVQNMNDLAIDVFASYK